MPEIIFASDEDIIFEKTVRKNGRCEVVVKRNNSGSAYMTYRFKDVPALDSPYISWENLNCCGGWGYDRMYLYTAVQRGRKLYAGLTFTRNETDNNTVFQEIEKIKETLPDDCLFGNEEPPVTKNGPYSFHHFFVCKTGAISDYISVDDVLAAYDRFGLVIDAGTANNIKDLCDVQLKNYAKLSAPVKYVNTPTGVDLIVSGLLLGYPLESTAWLIEKDGLLPVRK